MNLLTTILNFMTRRQRLLFSFAIVLANGAIAQHLGTHILNRAREALTIIQDTVAFAIRQIGKPYVWGAEGPNGFDCSGLVSAAIQEVNPAATGRLVTKNMQEDLKKPENQQYIRASCNEAQPGDLVWWPGKGGSAIGHTAIVGERPPEFIAAQGGKDTEGSVKLEPDLNYREGAKCFQNFYLEKTGSLSFLEHILQLVAKS